MRKITTTLGLVLLLTVAGCQDRESAPSSQTSASSFEVEDPASSGEVVRVFGPEQEVTTKPGGTASATVELRIAEGWHLNAHEPSEGYLIGTELLWDLPDGFRVADASYPSPETAELSFSETPLEVLVGRVPVSVTLGASAAATPGTKTLNGQARVQACNEDRCLPPDELPFSVDLFVDG